MPWPIWITSSVSPVFSIVMSAVLLAVPFLVWLVWVYGARRLGSPQLALVAVVTVAACAIVFAPYLFFKGTNFFLQIVIFLTDFHLLFSAALYLLFHIVNISFHLNQIQQKMQSFSWVHRFQKPLQVPSFE